MPVYPNTKDDTVLYEKENVYGDQDITITMLDGAKLNVWGETYVNGSLIGSGGAAVPVATQAEAEAGVRNDVFMTPLRVEQAIDYQTFGATEPGTVPAPGTVTGKFLKDDGTWGIPAGGSFASKAETLAGTITDKAVNPAGLSASALGTVNFSDAVVLSSRHGTIGAGNDQAAITNALNEVASNGGGVLRIPFIPGYRYVAQQIVVPDTSILIIGSGYGRYSTTGGVIQQASGVNDDFIIFTANALDPTVIHPFGIMHLGIMGASGATAGSGIVTRLSSGTGIVSGKAIMVDGCFIDHVWTVGFAEDGLKLYGGTPLWVNDINATFNGGYGVRVEDAGAPTSSTLHHTVLRNISGDGNLGGGTGGAGATLYVKGPAVNPQGDLGEYSMVLQGIKSEYRQNTLRPGSYQGNFNAVILDNVRNAIHVQGVTHIARGSATDKPGSAIRILGAGRPRMTWDAVSVRVTNTQTVGTDPGVITDEVGTTYTIAADVASGSLGSTPRREDVAATSGLYFKGIPGQVTPSVGDIVDGISGTVPVRTSWETDAPVDEKLWGWVHSGGDLTLRTFTDAGVSTNTAMRFDRTGTAVSNIEVGGGTLRPIADNTTQLGIASLRWSGVNAVQYRVGSSTGPLLLSGTGTPEGVVTAVVGSHFLRTDGGANTSLYVKETGAGNTGWVGYGAGGGLPAATNTETIAGSLTTKAVTPASLLYERPYVDVRTYGAIGDGTTNNLTALQAAIDAAFAAGIPCLIPAGTFLITGNRLNCKGRIIGAGKARTVIKQSSTNQGILDFDSQSDWEVSDLTLESNSAATHYRALWIRGAGVRGSVFRVGFINGGLYVSGGNAAFDTSAAPTTPGLQKLLVIDSVYSLNAKEYGISLDCVQGVDITNAQVQGAAVDGIKCLHSCDDVTITGGFAIGCAQEGIDAFMGGRNLTVSGFKAISNSGNGITVKSDDNLYDLGNFQLNAQINLIGLICRSNAGCGLTIDRNGTTDDPTNWLLSHVAVLGGVFESNTAAGIRVRARNVSLVSSLCRRNGQQGIRLDPEAIDCEIISAQVTGNSQTTVNIYDGVNINGIRNKMIGGFSIGKDANTIKNDSDYAALTAQQRYGAVIVSGSTDCEIHNVTAFGNATGDVVSSAASGIIRSRSSIDVIDGGSVKRAVTLDSQSRLWGGSVATGALSLANTWTQKQTLSGEIQIGGPLNHDGTTVGFYNTTPIAQPSGVTPAVALQNLGLGTSLVDITQAAVDLKEDKAQTINAQTGTTYTLALTDQSKLVTLNNAAAITLTVPTNASVAFPIGSHVDIAQIGAGQVTVSGTPTINCAMAGKKTRAQYSGGSLVKTATDTWLFFGDLA